LINELEKAKTSLYLNFFGVRNDFLHYQWDDLFLHGFFVLKDVDSVDEDVFLLARVRLGEQHFDALGLAEIFADREPFNLLGRLQNDRVS